MHSRGIAAVHPSYCTAVPIWWRWSSPASSTGVIAASSSSTRVETGSDESSHGQFGGTVAAVATPGRLGVVDGTTVVNVGGRRLTASATRTSSWWSADAPASTFARHVETPTVTPAAATAATRTAVTCRRVRRNNSVAFRVRMGMLAC
jgi:hypothetical protein